MPLSTRAYHFSKKNAVGQILIYQIGDSLLLVWTAPCSTTRASTHNKKCGSEQWILITCPQSLFNGFMSRAETWQWLEFCSIWNILHCKEDRRIRNSPIQKSILHCKLRAVEVVSGSLHHSEKRQGGSCQNGDKVSFVSIAMYIEAASTKMYSISNHSSILHADAMQNAHGALCGPFNPFDLSSWTLWSVCKMHL